MAARFLRRACSRLAAAVALAGGGAAAVALAGGGAAAVALAGGGAAAAAVVTSEDPAATFKLCGIVPIRLARDSLTAASIVADYNFSLWGLEEGSVEYARAKHEVHTRGANRLQELCFRNGGIYIKLGQHMAQLEYVLPMEYVQTMRISMLKRCPVSSYDQVCEVFTKELGKSPEEMYASQYFSQISELLRRLPRVILLMLKTNDCLRAVNNSLLQGSSLEAFLIIGRVSSGVIAETKMLQQRSFLSRLSIWLEGLILEARLFSMQIALWFLQLRKALSG